MQVVSCLWTFDAMWPFFLRHLGDFLSHVAITNTGKEIQTPASKTAKFTPGKALKESL
jgi:hypothetical protein